MHDEYDLEYWNKVKIVRDLNLKIELIKKNDKKKEEDTKKVVKMILKAINDKDILEGGRILYNKNRILRFGMNIFFKYFVNTFKKYSDKQDS